MAVGDKLRMVQGTRAAVDINVCIITQAPDIEDNDFDAPATPRSVMRRRAALGEAAAVGRQRARVRFRRIAGRFAGVHIAMVSALAVVKNVSADYFDTGAAIVTGVALLTSVPGSVCNSSIKGFPCYDILIDDVVASWSAGTRLNRWQKPFANII